MLVSQIVQPNLPQKSKHVLTVISATKLKFRNEVLLG